MNRAKLIEELKGEILRHQGLSSAKITALLMESVGLGDMLSPLIIDLRKEGALGFFVKSVRDDFIREQRR